MRSVWKTGRCDTCYMQPLTTKRAKTLSGHFGWYSRFTLHVSTTVAWPNWPSFKQKRPISFPYSTQQHLYLLVWYKPNPSPNAEGSGGVVVPLLAFWSHPKSQEVGGSNPPQDHCQTTCWHCTIANKDMVSLCLQTFDFLPFLICWGPHHPWLVLHSDMLHIIIL